MKKLILTAIFAFIFTSAFQTMAQTNVINTFKKENNKNESHEQIKKQTEKHNQMNKIESQLNTYKYNEDNINNNMIYELEKKKLDIKNK